MDSCKKTHYSKMLLVFLSLFLCFPGVMAQTVSFADPDSTVHKDVYMYNNTGQLVDSFNTTSTGIYLPSEDVIFVLKPQYSNPLDEPSTFLNNAIAWLQTNVLALIILAAMGGLLLRKW